MKDVISDYSIKSKSDKIIVW